MQFTDMLAQTGGLQAMARELGVSEAQASSGAAAPGLTAMLDLDGDGNPLDDILRMIGKVLG